VIAVWIGFDLLVMRLRMAICLDGDEEGREKGMKNSRKGVSIFLCYTNLGRKECRRASRVIRSLARDWDTTNKNRHKFIMQWARAYTKAHFDMRYPALRHGTSCFPAKLKINIASDVDADFDRDPGTGVRAREKMDAYERLDRYPDQRENRSS
jgi:hypothetical protein